MPFVHSRRAVDLLLLLMASALVPGCTAPSGRWEQVTRDAAATRSAAAQRLGDRTVAKIAFGSCAKQQDPQPVWEAICAQHPDLFLFIGDNIYADTSDPAVLKSKYAQLAAQPGYRKLRRICPVLATWDDHDYGLNDGGADFGARDTSQQVFCDFFGDPPNSPRRQRPGVYDAATFGPPGRRVQVILLDTRYFRSPLVEGDAGMLNAYAGGRAGKYIACNDPASTILGPAQWAWLEEQLAKPAELRILASSIQVVSEEHGFEKWMNFPHERERLCKLLAKTRAGGVVIVSGDRHHGELSRLDGCGSYPLFDLTSSGLNQRKDWYNELNRHRVGRVYSEDNFGLVEIDWDAPDPMIRLEIRKVDGGPAIQEDVRLSQLQP